MSIKNYIMDKIKDLYKTTTNNIKPKSMNDIVLSYLLNHDVKPLVYKNTTFNNNYKYKGMEDI